MTVPLPLTVTVSCAFAVDALLRVAVQVPGVPATMVTVPVLPVPVQPALQATVSVGLANVAASVTTPAGNLAVQVGSLAEVQVMPVGVLVMLPLPTTVTVRSVVVTGGGVAAVIVAVQVAGVPATMLRVAVLPVPVQPALQATVSAALVGVAVRVTLPAAKLYLQGDTAEEQALIPAGLLVTLPLPTTVTDSSVPVGGGVPAVKVATHTAGVLATIVTVLIMPVPVQSPVQATVSMVFAGFAVKVTFPAGNLVLQGAAEVQSLIPAGLLVTLPVPTTFRVKSPVVGCGVVKVAVQVAGVPATMVSVPVFAAVPAAQPLLHATVAPVGGEAVRVTAPAGKLAVQVGSLAEVQLLIPTGVLLLMLPVPTTVTSKAVPVGADAKVAVQVAGVPTTTFTVPILGLEPTLQPLPQVTLPPVGTVAIIVTVPASKLALQLAPPVEVQLVKPVLGALTLPAPTTVMVSADWVTGGGVAVKVTAQVTGLVPFIVTVPFGQVEPQVIPVVGLATRVTLPAAKLAAQVGSLAEVQPLIPVGVLLAMLPLPVTATVNLD